MTSLIYTIGQKLRAQTPIMVFQRFREKKPYIRRYGYEEKVFTGGLLPRLKDAKNIPLPDYQPKNAWSEKRALLGQNDYIDILGNGLIHPVQTYSRNVPVWLRGFKGNELQRVIRQMKQFHGYYYSKRPQKYHDLTKRMRYLYRYFNRKTDSAR